MKVTVADRTTYQEASEAHLVFLYEDGIPFSQYTCFDKHDQSMIDNVLKAGVFTGKDNEILYLPLVNADIQTKLLLVGLGQKTGLTFEKFRKRVGLSIKELKKHRISMAEVSCIGIDAEQDPAELMKTLTETAILAEYRFDRFLSQNNKFKIDRLTVICEEGDTEQMQQAVSEGTLLGEATTFARNLVNEPANELPPVQLAERARQAGEAYGFDVKIYDEEQIDELGMKAFREVSKGSIHPPRLIVMKYIGDAANQEYLLGLVGKGITYDSGGLSLKTKTGMVNMKNDMAGAAAVIGAMSVIAKAKLPVNVVAIVAACENMLSATGYRPGDIIGSMAGKSIMIRSTDAEGRLTLADAVYYAIEREGAKYVVDIATLTGAAQIALGGLVTAVMSNNDELYTQLEAASDAAGERVCRIPLVEEYRKFLKYDVADLVNSAGGKGPNMILGGMFIGEFITKGTPWVHMDIAGTSWTEENLEYIPKGGTGTGVRTLYYLAKNFKNSSVC